MTTPADDVMVGNINAILQSTCGRSAGITNACEHDHTGEARGLIQMISGATVVTTYRQLADEFGSAQSIADILDALIDKADQAEREQAEAMRA